MLLAPLLAVASLTSLLVGKSAADDDACALTDAPGSCGPEVEDMSLLQTGLKSNTVSDTSIDKLGSKSYDGRGAQIAASRHVGVADSSESSRPDELLTSQHSDSHECGSHVPPTRRPKICVFVFTVLHKEEYRKRTLSVARTWAMNAGNISQDRFSLQFFVDPRYRRYVDSVLTSSQILDYKEIGKSHESGRVPYTQLNALNSTLQTRSCDWVVVPEDDVYMNLALVARKLSCLDSTGPPRLLGSVSRTRSHSHPKWKPFVHGSVYIMSSATVPELLQVVKKRHLAQRPVYSDVALAECLHDEYREKREQAFPFQRLGCAIFDNNRSHGVTLSELQRHPEPECVDWFHKVLPENMVEVHKAVSRQECRRSAGHLLHHCSTKFKPQ